MTTPIVPDWAIESDDTDSTDTTEIVDHYGPSLYPCPSVTMFVAQRTSTRDGLALHDVPRGVLFTERDDTALTAGDLRALALAALDLADQLDTIDYAPHN